MPLYPQRVPSHTAYREAVIEAVDRITGVAYVRDSLGHNHDIPLRFQRSRQPVVGEWWVISREFGPWTMLTPSQPAINVTVPRKFVVTVGDGVEADVAVEHNFGTRDVVVGVYDSATYAEVPIESDELHPDGTAETDTHSTKYHAGAVLSGITRTDENTVTLHFIAAPAEGAYRVVVIG